MELEKLDLQEAKIKLLNSKGFERVEDIQEFFPRTYYDFSEARALDPALNEKYCAVIGNLDSVSTKETNKVLMVKASVFDKYTGKKLNVMWIGQYFMYKIIKEWTGEDVIVCGKLTYSEEYHSFHMNNPIIFDRQIEKHLSVYPVYTKMARISEEWMNDKIAKALSLGIEDPVPEYIAASHGLMSREKAVSELHKPSSIKSLSKARQRIVYDKLLEFAKAMEINERKISKGTIYNFKSSACCERFIASLPFKLTDSQMSVYRKMFETGYEGRRINALVQGDVGSGKTMVAILSMLLSVESGYQAVLVAPTTVLARQHYEEVKRAADMFGFKVAFLAGKQTVKEKKEIYAGIKDGTYHFVVGTHALLNDKITYKALGMAVCDEEHKFGVKQRDYLASFAQTGTHTVSMSATPIPRTMTSILYGSTISVYDLQLPAERKPIKTCIYSSLQGIYKFVEGMISSGEQIYVVCPLIESEDETIDLQTVEQTAAGYAEYFGKENVACLTGKMKSEEVEEVIGRFKNNEIKILISTTVIEVGVSNKNANVIVINNAERFGLAQLHQLRGRVGRGDRQGYCILNSEDRENERLITLCSTTNGFTIAEEDLKLRGGGDLLGYEQSGKTEILSLLAKYPNMYRVAKEDAKEIVNKMQFVA